jgi:hypothetical protein
MRNDSLDMLEHLIVVRMLNEVGISSQLDSFTDLVFV